MNLLGFHIEPINAQAVVASVIGLATIAFAVRRWISPRVHNLSRTWGALSETLLGRDEVVDNETGKELVPARSGLGPRLATMEAAICSLVDMHVVINKHDERLNGHDRDIAELQDARMERMVTQAESAQAWRAVADKDLGDE